MSNLRIIKSVLSAKVEIKDENGAPTGVFFEIAGPTHPKRKSILLANQRRLQHQLQKTGKVTLDDPAEQELQARDNLVSFTLGWSGFTDEKGKEVPFSPEAARELYENDEYSWLVDQLNAALNEKERFMQRSASN
jgi:hypothetical protein